MVGADGFPVLLRKFPLLEKHPADGVVAILKIMLFFSQSLVRIGGAQFIPVLRFVLVDVEQNQQAKVLKEGCGEEFIRVLVQQLCGTISSPLLDFVSHLYQSCT